MKKIIFFYRQQWKFFSSLTLLQVFPAVCGRGMEKAREKTSSS